MKLESPEFGKGYFLGLVVGAIIATIAYYLKGGA